MGRRGWKGGIGWMGGKGWTGKTILFVATLSLPAHPAYPALPAHPAYPALPAHPAYPALPADPAFPAHPAPPAPPTLAPQIPFEQAIRDLASTDADVRLRAAQMLKEAAYPDAAVPLARAVTDAVDEVQLQAIAAEQIGRAHV